MRIADSELVRITQVPVLAVSAHTNSFHWSALRLRTKPLLAASECVCTTSNPPESAYLCIRRGLVF